MTIENSGSALNEEQVARLRTPFVTTKQAGQGLGVPIATALTEASGGHIEFTRRPEGGLIVRVTLNEADAWSGSHD